MKILIVDDSQDKAQQLARVIVEVDPSAQVTHAPTAHDGFWKITQEASSQEPFNLVLLDLVLPLSLGQEPSEAGSVWFVKEAQRKIPGDSFPLIVGTTKYLESIAKVEDTFREYLRRVIYVGDADDRWLRQIGYALREARPKAQQRSLSAQGQGSGVDVALVTALQMPEFEELVDALGGGDPYYIKETGESWLHCKVDLAGGRQAEVMAACADEMGMPAMAALVTRLCMVCRPKKLLLAGIMGGNPARVGLTDLVVVEETWNSNAGKISEAGFEPDLKLQRCDQQLANLAKLVATDDLLMKLWREWKGEKPNQLPRFHRGAVACSPAVIADGQTFSKLEDQKRKIYGVEMEAFGCYDAVCRLGSIAPKVVCIKSVCDLGDQMKNDRYQRFCAHISASVMVSFIKDERFLDC